MTASFAPAEPRLAENPSRAFLVALRQAPMPLELDRIALLSAPEGAPSPAAPVAFRFCLDEVPFRARAERRDGRAAVTLEGELGVMPFTIESAARRRRLQRVVAAASRASGFGWAVDGRQRILVTGETTLDQPLTPAAVLTGIVALLLRLRPYLALVVAVAGEE
jgi:hypothetical protein